MEKEGIKLIKSMSDKLDKIEAKAKDLGVPLTPQIGNTISVRFRFRGSSLKKSATNSLISYIKKEFKKDANVKVPRPGEVEIQMYISLDQDMADRFLESAIQNYESLYQS